MLEEKKKAALIGKKKAKWIAKKHQ